MIRFLIICLFLGCFFIISIPIWGIEWIIGKFNPSAKDISCLRIVQWAFKVIRFLAGTKTTVIGFDNIPKDEPVLFVGNHRSFFDIIISYSIMPGLTSFVAKKEMNKAPFIRVWMRRLHCLFLDRDNIKEGLKITLKGIDLIKNHGISIAIFPEGTRARTKDMLPFKEGSLKFAEKSGCKIIPMVQNNTSAIFEDHFPVVKKQHTILEFGTPIDINELTPEDRKFLGAYTQRIIQDIYNKNEQLV